MIIFYSYNNAPVCKYKYSNLSTTNAYNIDKISICLLLQRTLDLERSCGRSSLMKIKAAFGGRPEAQTP